MNPTTINQRNTPPRPVPRRQLRPRQLRPHLAAAGLLVALLAPATASAQPAGPTAIARIVTEPADDVVAVGAPATLHLRLEADLADAAPGLFGMPGIYGFSGEIRAAGTAAGPEVTLRDVALSPLLPVGTAPGTIGLDGIQRVGAVAGLAGPGTADDLIALTFHIDITFDALRGGTLTYAFEGDVVLALGDRLLTFSTNPGPGQLPLNAPTTTIVLAPPCPADFNLDGSPGDLFDLFDFLNTLEPPLDYNGDTVAADIFDLFDFLNALDTPCP